MCNANISYHLEDPSSEEEHIADRLVVASYRRVAASFGSEHHRLWNKNNNFINFLSQIF